MKEYTLPNGKKVFHNNDRETEFLYEEIFLDKVYTSCGIKLKKDSVVLDVGANIGLFSVFVLENFSESKVYSFEPSPQIFKILKSNVSPYEGRCKTFKTGISDVEGEEEFLFYPDYSTFSTFYPDKMNTDKDRMENVVDAKTAERALIPVKEKCSLLTLSHIIKSEKIDHIDLLKMDVQRAELNVLKGIEKDGRQGRDW